ncbi:aspartate--tRNA ligase [Candidatus Giovannonibacteria bacterium]|nr:aspartate--tRNA ligase [Candidatus Giovannonibacteria bacterium]
MRTLSIEAKTSIGKSITLMGWIDIRRDHGKLIFLELRDAAGKIQLVVTPKNAELHKIAETLRPEWVVEITGEVAARPDAMKNPEHPTGEIELKVTDILVLNESLTPPLDISSGGLLIGEEVRMKYRYLDIRRPRLNKNLKNRFKALKFIRDFLSERGFTEVETPSLSKSTPEGARDYLVPSRIEPGKFYALPQSPQQYKQLLMVGGLEKYFQIARCFRDEDTRGDRQPEFTQLDLEMSFVQAEDVIKLNEELLINLIRANYPEKTVQEIPFPRVSYKEAMEKYGTDRPDLRKNKEDQNLLAFCWVVDFPFFEKTEEGGFTFTHNPFSAPKAEFMPDLMNKKNIGEILTTQYDVVLNGFEIGGGSIRNHKPDALKKVFEIMGFEEKKITENFGHMLEALSYGAPPHGGIAWGFDRLMMLLENEPNIREVIAFPKTGDARDLMMEAPSEVPKEQLKELRISVEKPREKIKNRPRLHRDGSN